MKRTDRFREQHKGLVGLVKQITASLNKNDLLRDAEGVRTLLATLAGKLSVHLTMEDDVLYPSLLKSRNESVRQTAQKFIDEMGGIKKAFAAYTDRWAGPTFIRENPEWFIKETTAIFDALSARIIKEDNELYYLVDKSE